MNAESLYESKYLNVQYVKNNILEGKNITIKDAKQETFESKYNALGNTKIVLSFSEIQKEFILNKINFEILRKKYGSETDNWLGKNISLRIVSINGKTGVEDNLQIFCP